MYVTGSAHTIMFHVIVCAREKLHSCSQKLQCCNSLQCHSGIYIPASTWPQYQGAVSAAMDGEGTGSVQDKDLTLPAVLDVELTTTQLPRQPTNNHTHLARYDELASIRAFFLNHG